MTDEFYETYRRYTKELMKTSEMLTKYSCIYRDYADGVTDKESTLNKIESMLSELSEEERQEWFYRCHMLSTPSNEEPFYREFTATIILYVLSERFYGLDLSGREPRAFSP